MSLCDITVILPDTTNQTETPHELSSLLPLGRPQSTLDDTIHPK